MSRRPSRLHTLERSVKAPRPARAKARALTVMRLEGSGAGVPTKSRPATLPKDMEDQIAVLRGRAPGRTSLGLLQLEERLLRARDVKPASQLVQRHDHGTMPVPAPMARAQAASFSGALSNEPYDVESFEDSSAMFSGASVGLPRTQYHASRTPAPINAEPYSPSSSLPAAQSIQAAPWSGANSFAADDAWMSPRPDRSVRQRALSSEQLAVAANFERDVAAMLGSPAPAAAPEDNQWNNTLIEAAKTTTAPPPAPPPVKPPETPAVPNQNTHEVFNQMGVAMNYANSFDLGAMDLSARLDHFEKELGLETKVAPAAPSRIPAQALALDDFDLVADLAEISGALSDATAPPAPPAEALSDSPTTNPEQALTPAG